MLNKQQIIRFSFSLALAVALTIGAGLVADTLDFPQTAAVMACGTSSGVGGGC